MFSAVLPIRENGNVIGYVQGNLNYEKVTGMLKSTLKGHREAESVFGVITRDGEIVFAEDADSAGANAAEERGGSGMNKDDRYTVKTFIGEVLMLIVCAFFIIPIYYLVVSTFKNQKEIMTSPLALPSSFTLDNYRKALDTMDFWRNFGNSLLITVCSVIFIIVFGSMALMPIVYL